jgi:hypothetical protein
VDCDAASPHGGGSPLFQKKMYKLIIFLLYFLIHSSIESTADQSLSISDLSTLVEGLVRADRCGEASKVTLGMLEKGLFPARRVMRFLLSRLAVAGDIDTLTAIGSRLTPVSISTAKCFMLDIVELRIEATVFHILEY